MTMKVSIFNLFSNFTSPKKLESQAKLLDIYDRLDEMDADKAEVKAAEILHGLGFTPQMMAKRCKDFSGGEKYFA
jgi:ATPase subunit of ABC transporter with duplicated ATPase domains